MKSILRRFTAILLAFTMVVGFVPMLGSAAYAADGDVYTVNVITSGDEYGTASANKESGKTDDIVLITAKANDGYAFDSWEVISGGVTIRDVQVAEGLVGGEFRIGTEDVVIKANFRDEETEIGNPTNLRWDGDTVRWDPVASTGNIRYYVRLYHGDTFDERDYIGEILAGDDNYVDLSKHVDVTAAIYRNECQTYWFSVRAVRITPLPVINSEVVDCTEPRAIRHQTEYVEAKAPTCTEDGCIAHWYCARCKSYFADEAGTEELKKSEVEIDKLGHDWDEGVVTKEASCTEAGEKIYTCQRCEETRKARITPTGHSWSEWSETKPATCAEKGERSRTCANCGEKETREIDKVDHTWGNWAVTRQPTCEVDGELARSCTVCGQSQVQTIKATGHKWDSGKVTTDPTCDTEGVKTYSCTVAGCDGTKTEAVPALGHKWDSGKVTTEPACETEGIKTYTCTVCGSTKKEAVPATGHTWEDIGIIEEATCSKAGQKVCKCTVCDKIDVVEIPKLEHTWVDKGITKEPTCAEEGIRRRECSVCGEAEDIKIAKLDHVWGKETDLIWPTCTLNGKKIYTCVNCGEKSEHTIPATGHKWGKWEVITAPTTTQTGIERRVCANDNLHRESRDIPVLAGECSKGALVYDAQLAIFSQGSDKDPKGSVYNPLCARASKTKKNSVTLKWNKVSGVDGYIIYGNRCGSKHPFRKLAELSGGKTTWTNKKLRKGTYYKYVVVAYTNSGKNRIVVSTSKTIHAATTGGKAGNVKSVKVTNVSKNAKTLNKGKTFTLKTKTTKSGSKVSKHRKLCYATSNKKVATVNGSGKITAVGKGTCNIYVYAQNGRYKTIKITVK